ncbi:ANTAR domain-containing protein [Longispora sp. K20-0274]|uniref:ANTAR domain-containing protein n=1 Tax=Longispora sp. K20-0274 TaxID=3088255 RepID=UPI00399B6F09
MAGPSRSPVRRATLTGAARAGLPAPVLVTIPVPTGLGTAIGSVTFRSGGLGLWVSPSFPVYARLNLPDGMAEQHARHLEEAPRARDVIGRAKGILMQRRGLSAEDAFEVPSQSSQRLNLG